MSADDRAFVRAISKLAYCNPFLPERIESERGALGADYVAADAIWHARADSAYESPNMVKLTQRAETVAERFYERLRRGERVASDELAFYKDLVLYLLYHRYEADFYRLILDPSSSIRKIGFYDRFLRDFERYLRLPNVVLPTSHDPPQLFAAFFQVRRAFHFIFRNIIGGSMPAARLRAAVWQSVFTRDMRRYHRSLYDRMHDVTTLISGPSGTGKELVAQAIGLARYIPFDPDRRAFTGEFAASFYPLNLSALSPTLIESELFGHRRGAFTGAVDDRVGWLAVCPPLGTVFLDEIAEVDVAIQVKLLRILQTRTFHRLGETKERRFEGKIIAATNRDLAVEMQAGRFRPDLYYRLCSDLIETPSLEEHLRDAPEDLGNLVLFIAQRVAGDSEAASLAAEAEHWIEENLGRDYRWPGNVRELEQCVRNVMIRGEYQAQRGIPDSSRDNLAVAFLSGSLTADELLRRYCTLVYARTGNYHETARRLGLDRRTVKGKIDQPLLEQLRFKNDSGRQDR